jgi:hypothetical protein
MKQVDIWQQQQQHSRCNVCAFLAVDESAAVLFLFSQDKRHQQG